MTGPDIRAWRQRLGLTQTEAAIFLGVERPHLARWEKRLPETRAAWLAPRMREVEADVERLRQPAAVADDLPL